MTSEPYTGEQRLQHCYERLSQQGISRITAAELNDHSAASERLVVMLIDDPLKYPAVTDYCAMIPDVVRSFPQGCFTLTFADAENSRELAERFKQPEPPAVLFFHHRHCLGALSGLHSGAVMMQHFRNKLRASPELIEVVMTSSLVEKGGGE